MFYGSNIAKFIPWIINIGYFSAIVPQVFLNYKLKSTKGLSNLYIWGYFSGYLAMLFYVYCLNFNLAYKVLVPFSFLAVSILVFQNFLYSNSFKHTINVRLYSSYVFLLLILIPLVLNYAYFMGNVAGWFAMMIWSIYQLPQIYKIYKRKSTKGFSFALVLLIGIGNFFEFLISFILNFPIQSIFIALRGFLICLVFCFQFWIYKDKKLQIESKTLKNAKK